MKLQDEGWCEAVHQENVEMTSEPQVQDVMTQRGLFETEVCESSRWSGPFHRFLRKEAAAS